MRIVLTPVRVDMMMQWLIHHLLVEILNMIVWVVDAVGRASVFPPSALAEICVTIGIIILLLPDAPMSRSTNLLASMILFLAVPPDRADAFGLDIGRVIDDVFDAGAVVAEKARETFCLPGEIKSKLCIAAMAAEDITGDLANPTTCGVAGHRTCLPILDQRYIALGGPCEPGLIEFPGVVCVAPWSAAEANTTAENIARLSLALIRAFHDFKAQAPSNVIKLISAIEANDAQAVEQIIRDGQMFDEAFDLMKGLGMDTATVGVGGGGFVVGGIGVELGVAIDTEYKALPQLYRTRGSSIGLQAGIGADLVWGGWMPSNCDIDGKATGRSVQIDAGPGAGSAIWYDDRGAFVGTTVAVGLGGVGGGVSKIIAAGPSYWETTARLRMRSLPLSPRGRGLRPSRGVSPLQKATPFGLSRRLNLVTHFDIRRYSMRIDRCSRIRT